MVNQNFQVLTDLKSIGLVVQSNLIQNLLRSHMAADLGNNQKETEVVVKNSGDF